MPSGAVSAFDARTKCPNGWDEFPAAAGRAIIGIGFATDPKEVRDFSTTGGSEKHLLTETEMPTHFHETTEMIRDDSRDGIESTVHAKGEHHREKTRTGASGGSQPHNNMPPYLVLRYCLKQ